MPSSSALLAAGALAACALGADAFSAPPLAPSAARAGKLGGAAGVCMAAKEGLGQKLASALIAGSLVLGSVAPAADAAFNFPPIDKSDKTRCSFKSSAIGQSNAARDKLYDLRECQMDGQDAKGFDIAGAIMIRGKFAKVDFKDAVMSKVYGDEANFDGAKFNNAIMDRSSYKGASFKGAVLANAVLSGTNFQGADLTDADFSDAYMGDFDNKNLCKNPTLTGTNPTTGNDSRMSAACR
eukprot:CAMPEP_0206244764 /NCGR_PEP_ID=MMETSP0047_2-20121206/18336_1 /ASSEMBLY_ACC=CAM_ASM_000192 /TAXON_ID=195065 /ORGANISM="Chroomonas mesostigmatica_cf, Strain CCMP1168" /LENGTH=238 /DNA_ID=CAMNT_0053670015 /DNA_START=18 /DNA_END=734 /DNA_ORIENTATION=+